MTNKNETSEFLTAAIALDAEFKKFEKLAHDLESLDINTDRGLERGIMLLKDLTGCRERFGPVSEQLAKGLADAQLRAARAIEVVAQRETELESRQNKVQNLLTRYKTLGDMVETLTSSVNLLRNSDNQITEANRAVFANKLPEFDAALTSLIDEAKKLMDEARVANVKDLVRNADSLRQSLQSTRHRFGQLAGITH